MSILTVEDIHCRGLWGDRDSTRSLDAHRAGRSGYHIRSQRLRQVNAYEDDIRSLLTPTQGSVVFEDTDITGMPTDRLIRMGMSYVPQTGNIFPSLTIEENLEMGAFVDDTRRGVSQVAEIYTNVPGPRTEQTAARRQPVGRTAADARLRDARSCSGQGCCC